MLKKMILTLLDVFALSAAFCLYFFLKNPNPDRPARIDDPNGKRIFRSSQILG